MAEPSPLSAIYSQFHESLREAWKDYEEELQSVPKCLRRRGASASTAIFSASVAS
jgi:hypothetical protein